MKLTEKELYDLPLGSKAIKGKNEYLKIRNNAWEKQYVGYSYTNSEMALWADKILIPTTWEEYIPILDDKEKEYLSAVIRPFRKRISKIEKVKNPLYKSEWIRFSLICDSIIDDSFSLPSFKVGTMYKGMDLDREYSLEELDI